MTKGCKRAPEVNGQLSSLYLNLFDMLTKQYKLRPEVARQLTNVLYVHYKSNNTLQTSLDNANKMRNNQDEHEANDVFQALNGDELVQYTRINELDTLSISEGIKLDTIHSVEFNTYQQAYQKAHDINNAHSNLSAYVVQQNGKYIVKVANMTTLNMVDRVNTENEMQQMQLISNALASIGVNLDNISFNQDTYFGKKYKNLVEWIKNIPLTNPQHLLKNDLKMLVSLFQNEQIVDRLITKFGSIDALVDTYYDWYRGNYNATPTTEVQLRSAMDLMHTFNGLDTQTLYNESNNLTNTIKQNSNYYQAQQLYDQLNDKFQLGSVSIETSVDDLTSITKVLAQTIMALGTEARSLKENGNKQGSQELYDKIAILDKELEQKEYIQGLSEFLALAGRNLNALLGDLVTQIPQGADITFIHQRGSALRRAAQYLEVYQPIIESIAKLEKLDKDIDISDQDIQSLQQAALKLSNTIIEITQATKHGIDGWARQALSLMLVENSEITVDEVLENMKHDATWFDRLYNGTKVSHIPTAVLANYIQATRRQRTAKLAQIAQRIGAIVNQVDPNTGKRHMINTSFMYESVESEFSTKQDPKHEWHIISEYDFDAFYKAKKRQIASLKRRGYTGQAFDLAMERWMINNTEEIVADQTTGRTERVPKLKKAVNPLNKLTPIQRTAYKQFLALKGELDSMLPEYARHLYTPPQLRMSAIDQLTSSKNFLVGIGRSLKEKYQQWFGVREDEVGMGQVKETDTGDIVTPYTDMTGSTYIVPVNYVQKLKNQNELLLNFAEGIAHLAQSAVNYDTIKEIVDTVEVLGDYLIDNVSSIKNGADMAQGFLYGSKLFYQRIKKHKSTNVERIINDQKNRLLYNDTTAGRSIKSTKALSFIRKVTSVQALTFNLFGSANNMLEGYRKNLEESLVYGTHTFDLVDLEYAHFKILKDHVGKTGSHLLDFFTGRKTSLGSLIMERFDPKKEKFHAIANKKYRTNIFRKLISPDLTMIGYAIGETLNNMPIVYATLHHIKVIVNGKKTYLVKAFERIDNGDGTYRLGIKKGATLLNGDTITEEFLDQVARQINEISETNHGGMSDEAMGEIATSILGMMTLQLRRWMIGVYSNYFRGEYFDASTGKKREGAWKGIYDVSFAPMIAAAWKHLPWSKEFAQDTATFKEDLIKNYKNLKPHQRLAAVRWLTATSIMTVFSILIDAFLKSCYPKYKDEEWFKILFYLLSRQKMDVASTVPDLNHIERIGDVGNSLVEIMDKPFASYSTVKTFTYPISGLPDYGEKIEKGPHKDEDRYLRNLRKYYWKPGELWDRIEGLEDTDELINSLGGFSKRYSAKKEYERLMDDEVDKKKETPSERRARKRKEREKKKEKD